MPIEPWAGTVHTALGGEEGQELERQFAIGLAGVGLVLGAFAVAATVDGGAPAKPASETPAAANLRLASLSPAARRDVDYARLDARLKRLAEKPTMVGLAVGLVENGRITFLSGYGVVQALPGPLFSFAGFVGASQVYGPNGIVGGLIAIFAIFLPSLLLVVGVTPFWDRLKREPWARGAVAGVGAVVVGMLAAALWDPMLVNTVRQPADWAMVAAAFIFLQVAKFPAWLVVIGFAAATGLFLPTVI